MIVNNEVEIKYFYRFIEFISKMLKVDLPHERFKLIILDNFKAESQTEVKVKNLSDAYLYLINSFNQSLTSKIIKKAYYLLSDMMLEEEVCQKILDIFYQNYDESSHYLAALIHFAVLDNVEMRNVEFAYMMSNLVMLKKQGYPFIPYEFMYETYFKAIEEKNINKIMVIFASIEGHPKSKVTNKEITQEGIIEKLKELRPILKGKYSIKKLYLYGSYAKNKVTNSSDIDLLVIFDKELLNIERSITIENVKKYLTNIMEKRVDLLDFTHAMNKLDISEMENIITII